MSFSSFSSLYIPLSFRFKNKAPWYLRYRRCRRQDCVGFPSVRNELIFASYCSSQQHHTQDNRKNPRRGTNGFDREAISHSDTVP